MGRVRAGSDTPRAREMRGVLADWERSGLRLTEFARQREISVATLSWWRHRLGRSTAATEFVEVRPTAIDAGRAAVFEVVLPSGVLVRVPSAFDGSALERLLTTLSRC